MKLRLTIEYYTIIKIKANLVVISDGAFLPLSTLKLTLRRIYNNFGIISTICVKKMEKNILEKEREASKNYPFANLDFKFSLKKEVEEGRNLIAVHNLTSGKLEKA